MTLRIIPYRPGVIGDDTAYASEGYAIDSDKIAWVQGRAEWLGGWESATVDTVSGTTRGLHPWANNAGIPHLGIGTNCRLYVYRQAQVYNLTPERDSGTLSSDPFQTDTNSPTVTVTQTAHGASTGDTVYISRSDPVGGITPGGPTFTGVSDPLIVAEGSRTVVVTVTGHTMTTGDIATFSGASAVGGLTISGTYLMYVVSPDLFTIDAGAESDATTTGGGTVDIDFGRQYVVTVIDADTYTFEHIEDATSAATGGGSSVSYLWEIACGNESALNAPGFGVGGYGVGPFGLAAQPNADSLPRIWAINNFGEFMVASYNGGPIYQWELNVSQRADVLSNAPDRNNWSLVTPERFLMAFGTEDLTSTFNPMLVRWSDFENSNEWQPTTTNLAGDLLIAEGSRIISARNSRGGILCWTDTALYSIRYTAEIDSVYVADLISTGTGLIGPNAAIDRDGLAFWISPARYFFLYRGGTPVPLDCPLRRWFADTLAIGQEYKVWAAFDNARTGVYWFFPSRSGLECDTYIRYDILAGAADPKAGWSRGTFDRTAWVDRGVFERPYAVSPNGNIFIQEQGLSANGAALSRFVEWAPIDLTEQGGDGNYVMNVRRVVLDAEISSNAQFTLSARRWPNAPATTYGPYTVNDNVQKTDVRVQGRQVGMRIETNGTSNFVRLGAIRMDLSQGPRR